MDPAKLVGSQIKDINGWSWHTDKSGAVLTISSGPQSFQGSREAAL